MPNRRYGLVVVANRLPVDVAVDEHGEITWQRSPGGLVAALEPVLKSSSGAWVGWSGANDQDLEPFDAGGISVVPVPLSTQEFEEYYEGFANATLWPLYHDVITPPEFHRVWWDCYVKVNDRFARAAAEQVAPGGTVWVQDYQLQLVPQVLRRLRPDIVIGFFNHIPFPPVELFSQLPWRRQILRGLLGADLLGFQRASDASNFVRATRRLLALPGRGQHVFLQGTAAKESRIVRAAAYPISIAARDVNDAARQPRIVARAKEIRKELGNPDTVMLGVDRLDYTKGIRHRLKAYGELLAEGRMTVPGTVLVQVASPSRENVEAYQALRDEVETTVGRINGDFAALGQVAVEYLHQNRPFDEMIALYLAADVMLVTSLRDGMNLVAKEYVAARTDEHGALVLSEFTGAADELTAAIQVNPHDIEELKDAMVQAATMDRREQRRRMRSLRRRVIENDVDKWAERFLTDLRATAEQARAEVAQRSVE